MKTRVLALLAVLAAASASHAAVLVSFDMSTIAGTGSTKGSSASAFDSGLTAGNLLKNNLTNASPVNTVLYGGNAAGTWTTNTAQALSGGSVDIGTTVTNANYITFTLTPLAGSQINISSITFNAAASSASTARSIHLFSSATGFTSSDVLLSAYNTTAGGGANGLTLLPLRSSGALGSYTYTATAPAFSGITTPVEFRIYLQTGLANQDIDFDNIVVNGSVIAAIPEPSSYAMAAAAVALGAGACRRRRR